MFKLVCSNVQTINTKDGRVFYRIWFNLPDGSLAWLMSDKEYKPGDEVPLRLSAMASQDVKTNLRLTVRIG